MTLEAKDATIRVTWKLPQCSRNIRQITVQYRKDGETNWPNEVKAAASSTEVLIENLEKGVEYEVRVVVVDTAGNTHQMVGTGKKIAKTGKFTSYFDIMDEVCTRKLAHHEHTD